MTVVRLYATIKDMKLGTYAYRLYWWLLYFIQIQLFISLISVPILIAWGLPFSLLSPIGNLIFTPFLSLFLLLSTGIFFCQIVALPNEWLISALEFLTTVWMRILHSADIGWLVGFRDMPILVLVAITASAFAVLLSEKTASVYRSIFCFSGLFGILFFIRWFNACDQVFAVPCNRGVVTVIQKKGSVVVIDPGFIGQRCSAASWLTYTCAPAMIKKTGSLVIDHLIVLQPTVFLLQGLAEFVRCVTVKNLYLPYWSGQMKKTGLRAYYDLKNGLLKNGGRLIRFGDGESAVQHLPGFLVMQRLEKQIDAGAISYGAYQVCVQIDNREITFYSAKYRQPIV